jgi:hypothetical protein
VSVTEELLEWKCSGSGDSLRQPRDILYPQKLALTSPTSGGSSVGIVSLQNKTTEFSLVLEEVCYPRRNVYLAKLRKLNGSEFSLFEFVMDKIES